MSKSVSFMLLVFGVALMMIGVNLITGVSLSNQVPAPSPQSDRSTPTPIADDY